MKLSLYLSLDLKDAGFKQICPAEFEAKKEILRKAYQDLHPDEQYHYKFHKGALEALVRKSDDAEVANIRINISDQVCMVYISNDPNLNVPLLLAKLFNKPLDEALDLVRGAYDRIHGGVYYRNAAGSRVSSRISADVYVEYLKSGLEFNPEPLFKRLLKYYLDQETLCSFDTALDEIRGVLGDVVDQPILKRTCVLARATFNKVGSERARITEMQKNHQRIIDKLLN